MYQHIIKNLLDRIFAILLILFLAIPILLIAVLVKITSPGPVFFKQIRLGLHKKPFQIIKFRTMKNDAPHNIPTPQFTESKKWITKTGAFLRRTSLDELPQLINIATGDMSFVGPRPSLGNEENLISERDRYNVYNYKPGLTGWAQINGRNSIDIQTKAKLDKEYTQKISFIFDLKCIAKTFRVIIQEKQ